MPAAKTDTDPSDVAILEERVANGYIELVLAAGTGCFPEVRLLQEFSSVQHHIRAGAGHTLADRDSRLVVQLYEEP